MSSLFGILALWRRQSGWLLLGAIASLATLACGVALMAASGSAVSAGLIAGSVLLRTLGVSRVVMRYIERLITHMATFRALADLRVWFFRGWRAARRAVWASGAQATCCRVLSATSRRWMACI